MKKHFYLAWFSVLCLLGLQLGCYTPKGNIGAYLSSEQDTLALVQALRASWKQAGAHTASMDRANAQDTLIEIENAQHQLNALSENGGGVLWVPADTFELHSPLCIPSQVSLKGMNRAQSVIRIHLKEGFEATRHHLPPSGHVAALLMDRVKGAEIANLTIIYGAADFEPKDFDAYDHPWERPVYHKVEARDDSLMVSSIWIEESQHCQVRNCRILKSGNDPIRIRLSQHITCRNNFIDRSYNKADRGEGYYNLIQSEYCLIYADTVRRIRHFSIHKQSRFNVVYGCDFQVDVNFHNGDLGYNLVENNSVRVPVWHSWGCFMHGVASKHGPPGPFNILAYNETDKKNRGPVVAADSVYLMNRFYSFESRPRPKVLPTDWHTHFPDGFYQPQN